MKAESGGGERGVDDEKKAGLFFTLICNPISAALLPTSTLPPAALASPQHQSIKRNL